MTRQPFWRLAAILGVAISLATAAYVSPAASYADGTTIHGPGAIASAGQTLTPAETAMLSQGAKQNVIVVMQNQPSSQTHAITTDQAPVLSEMQQVGAQNVKPLHIINAIVATVSANEVSYLQSAPGVMGVVPDKSFRVTPVTGLLTTKSNVGANTIKTQDGNVSDPSVCSSNSASPVLEPQALQLINDESTPAGVDGTGVNVAILADGIDINNPDLERGGNPIITHYADFTGDGWSAPTGGGEAFLDASAVAAQGSQTYDYNSYLTAAGFVYTHPTACYINIRGVAPGVTITFAKVVNSAGFATTSSELEGIQFAVDNGANVINESLGANVYPDTSLDPISLANQQAVDDGIVVSVAAGDAGPMGTIGTPSTAPVPGVLSVGATTSLRIYAQATLSGFQLGSGGWVDNNMASLSSGGINEYATKTVSLVAPGDLNWALCDTSSIYADCGGQPIQITGGTSQAAPQVSGAAALVIEAYRNTHSGATPTPALVQQILQSSATDLGIPSDEQGSGLLNVQRAVTIAESYSDGNGTPTSQGPVLVSNATVLTATDQPGTPESLPFQVTNTGSSPTTVQPSGRILNQLWHQHFSPYLNPTADQSFIDEVGTTRPYVAQNFNVPSGTQFLDANIAWSVAGNPESLVRIDLFDPNGNFVTWSDPQTEYEPSEAFGHVDVRDPTPGQWTAILWTHLPPTGYQGTVQMDVTGYNYVQYGTVQPQSQTVAPGQTASFNFLTSTPSNPGDLNASIVLNGDPNTLVSGDAGVIPVALRSLIPTANGGTHTFSGTLTGGNGRAESPGQVLTYQFDVPAGLRDVDLGIQLPWNQNQYNLEGVLVDPASMPVDVQSTVQGYNATTGLPTSYSNALQFFRDNPAAGRWTFILLINNNSGGTATSTPFTGVIRFNGVRVFASGLSPQPHNGQRTPATPNTTYITIQNTGDTTEDYFVDPRLDQTEPLDESFSGELPFPPISPAEIYPEWPAFVVPPFTSQFATAAEDSTGSTPATVPLLMDTSDWSGAIPDGIVGSPDIEGTPFVDPYTGDDAVIAEVTAPEVGMGFWYDMPQESGNFTNSPAVPAEADVAAEVNTQAFDTSAVSSTGDAWLLLTGLNPNETYTPLVLKPGQAGTIKVTVSRTGGPGTLNIETLAMDSNGDVITGVSDEVASIPY